MKNRTILIVALCVLIGIVGVETGILIANKHTDKSNDKEKVGVIVNTSSSDGDLEVEEEPKEDQGDDPEDAPGDDPKDASKDDSKDVTEETTEVQVSEEPEEPVTTLMDLYGEFKAVFVGGLKDHGDYYSATAEIYGYVQGSTITDWPGECIGTNEVKLAKDAVVHWHVPGEAPDYTMSQQDISLDEYVHMYGRDYSTALIRMMGGKDWSHGNAPIEYNEKGYIVGFYDAPVS